MHGGCSACHGVPIHGNRAEHHRMHGGERRRRQQCRNWMPSRVAMP